jgi:hypothetical protein
MTQPKTSRTTQLLIDLKVPADFKDPKLPRGVFSYSQYTSFKICAQAYAYNYVHGVLKPSYAPTVRGNSVHKGLEFAVRTYLKEGRWPTIVEVREAVSKEFDERAKEVENWGELDPGRVKDEALKLYDVLHTKMLPKIKPLSAEKGFAVKFGGVPVVGWIDLIDEVPSISVPGLSKEDQALSPTMKVTVDLKTVEKKWSDNDLHKSPQLTLYSFTEGTPLVRVDQLVMYKKGYDYVPASSTRTKNDADVLAEDMNEVVDLIHRGIFPKCQIDNWACNVQHCSFFSMCRGRKR